MSNLQSVPSDFDAWMLLAESNPKAFELTRRRVIEVELAKAPPAIRARLEGLQWRIDMERKRQKNPMGSCIRLFEMMWDQVYGTDGLLDALTVGTLPRPLRRSAKILPLARTPRDRL